MQDNVLTLENDTYQDDAELEGELYVAGTRGYSAYEVAVINGYIGTEEEWLASLQGEDGVTPTIGDNGNWFIGETDTGLPSRGIQGEPGQDGQDGYTPSASVSKSGKTATITITDAEGTTTASISDGEDGQDGVGVPSGGTTGQILNKASNTDYATQWSSVSDLNLVTTNTNQNISGKKTFTSYTPECSNVPIYDNQLTNKKYVDDSVANLTYCIGNITDYNMESKALNLDNLEDGKTYVIVNDLGPNMSGTDLWVKVTSETYGVLKKYKALAYNKAKVPVYYICKHVHTETLEDQSTRTYYAQLTVISSSPGENYFINGVYEYYEKEGTGGVGVLDIENNSSSLFAVNTNKAQTISGLKTFNTLPESSVVPTSDNQFVNKKYVDDNAGGGSSNYLGYIEDYTSSNRLDITDLEKGTYLISSKMGNWDELYLYVKATYNDEVKTFDLYVTKDPGTCMGNLFYLIVKNPMSTISGNDEVFSLEYYIYYGMVYNLDRYNLKVNFNTSTGTFSAGTRGLQHFYITTRDTEQTIAAKKTFTVLPESSVAPTTANQLTNKTYVDSKSMQVSTMPTADSTTVGKIVQYTGTTDSTYTNGYFYIGTTDGDDPATYSWEQINVQPSGGSSSTQFNVPTYHLELDTTGTGYNGVTFNSTDKTAMAGVINDAYSKGYSMFNIMLTYLPSNGNYPQQYLFFISNGSNYPSILSKPTSLRFTCVTHNSGNSFISTANAYAIICASLEMDLTWSEDVCTVTNCTVGTKSSGVITSSAVLLKTNTTAYTPSSNYHPATKLYVDTAVLPTVTSSATTTYRVTSLVGNQVYKLGEITELRIDAVTTFDKESIFYFESGSTATDIIVPSSLTNLGDVPSLSTAGSTATGTCDTGKSYIISVLNNIAVWKAY